MGYYLSEPAPSKGDPTAKNRVWGFFGESVSVSLETRRAALETHRENYGEFRRTASGIPLWPSRDPIGPNLLTGEFNEFAFILNWGPNAVDFLGLTIVKGSAGLGGNCLGGAVMNNSEVHLQPDHTKEKDQSFKEALEKQFGMECKEVKNRDECKCKCDEEKILITLYKDEDPKNKGKNPWNDPDFEWNMDQNNKPKSDIHSIRADRGCDNNYKQVPRAQDAKPGQEGFDKNINWDLFKGTPLLCCCYKEEK